MYVFLQARYPKYSVKKRTMDENVNPKLFTLKPDHNQCVFYIVRW